MASLNWSDDVNYIYINKIPINMRSFLVFSFLFFEGIDLPTLANSKAEGFWFRTRWRI
jgi:hypothetical protein